MFKRARIEGFSLALLIAFSLLLAGCGGNSDSPSPADASNLPALNSGAPTTPASESTIPTLATVPPVSTTPVQPVPMTAQEIATNSVTVTEKINTLKFDMDLEMIFGTGMDGSMESMNMKQTGTAAVNIPDKKMMMTMDMSMSMPEETQYNMSGEIYTVDGWMYMKATTPNAGEQWSKMQLTEEMWEQQSQFSSMTDFMKSPVNLDLADNEVINGIDCYVLNITPDQASLANWMEGQTQSEQAGQIMNNLGADQLSDNFKVKMWISKESNLPIRQQIAMKFANSSGETEATPSIFDQMGMELNMTIDFYDYNKAVDIQLPAEALNAQDMTQAEYEEE